MTSINLCLNSLWWLIHHCRQLFLLNLILCHLFIHWLRGVFCSFSGVFYFGFIYILPVVYVDSSPTVLWLHEYFCYFMLVEMLVNWACVKWVKSPFQAGDYKPEYGTDDNQLLATGFEINLNNLKRTGKETMDVAGQIHANQVNIYVFFVITAHKRSSGKVMFLHMSVCSHGGLASQHASQVT